MNAPLPPQNIEAEESVLGACMISSSAIDAASAVLEPADFYRESHGRIFRAIVEKHERGEPVDALTLTDELDRLKLFDDVVTRDKVFELAAIVPAASNAAHHAWIVRDAATRRAVQAIGQHLAAEGRDVGDAIEQLTAARERQRSNTQAELVFSTLEAFAAIDEPGAEPLASAVAGGVLIPANGLVIVYGDGGAGKTTLVIDLCFALAGDESWLDLITAARPLRIAIVENEGPRQELRDKLERKLAGRDLAGRIVVLEEPWAAFTFADDTHRRALAGTIDKLELDLLVVGPLSSVGMEGGGTPDEITRFEQLIRDVRQLVDRSFAVILVHHENRAGQISGAWERVPDTLVHVTGQGHGRTRLYWQKARWSSELHGTTTQLLWADGESYTLEARPEVTEDSISEQLLAVVREHPGASWSKIRDLRDHEGQKRIRGKGTTLDTVRDRLIAAGTLINAAPRKGQFALWVSDDPAAPRSPTGTDWERLTFPPPADEPDPDPFPVPAYRGNGGNGNGTGEPETDPEIDWSQPTDREELDRLEAIADELGLQGGGVS